MEDELPLIECIYKNEAELYQAYMPFVKGGGLFVRTKQHYPFGSRVKVMVQLPDNGEDYLVESKIVWMTPKGAQGNKPVGIGVQFVGDNARSLSNKIETALAGMLKSTQLTDTL